MRVVRRHVTEHGRPERSDVRRRRRRHRRLHHLQHRRVGLEAEIASRPGDAAGEFDVAGAQVAHAAGHQLDHDPLAAQVDVGVVARRRDELGDRRDESRALRVRRRAEERMRTPEQDPPVVDALGVVELLRRDRLDIHASMLATTTHTHGPNRGGANDAARPPARPRPPRAPLPRSSPPGGASRGRTRRARGRIRRWSRR